MNDAVCIAIVGAESTGKTTLAAALAATLAARTGLRATWVPEVLRDWCDAAGRTPRADEQVAILNEQHANIEAAAARHAIVVCDTTGLMTAVYSALIFDDDSLQTRAASWHARHVALTLLTATDLPWVADGHQRDGPQVQAPVDALLRALLASYSLPHAVVAGSGAARLQQALAACAPLLKSRGLLR